MNTNNGVKLRGYARFKPLQEEVLRLREEKVVLLDALRKAKEIMTTYNLMNSLAGSYVETAIQNAEQ